MGSKLPDLRTMMGEDDEPEAGPQSPDQMLSIAMAWNAALRGKVERADG